jgi:hypothetical protein
VRTISFRYWQTFFEPGRGERPQPCVPLYLRTLTKPARELFTFALVDSGADSALFGPAAARLLGIDLKSGHRKQTHGITGAEASREHRLELTVFSRSFQADVAFVERWDHDYGLLGLNDIYAVFQIAIIQPEQLLLAEPIDGP